MQKRKRQTVAANITKLLNEQSFSLTPLEFLNIHRHLFEGIFKHAGEIRPYDISKRSGYCKAILLCMAVLQTFMRH